MRGYCLILLCLLPASCAKRAETADTSTAEPKALTFPSGTTPPGSPQIRLEPLPPAQPSILINAGALPLVQLFDQGGRVRILDVTTKQTLLSANVPPHSIISVNESGILIARQRRLTTPLNPTHRFEIWWDQAASDRTRAQSR